MGRRYVHEMSSYHNTIFMQILQNKGSILVINFR